MFGQHNDEVNDNQQQADGQDTAFAEPMNDGTLGVPAPDSMDGGAAGAPASLPTPSTFQQHSLPPDAALPRQAVASTPGDLISIKQAALTQLKPLVGHLEQAPEEKFRTTMMMIQAADDQSLINDAYEAAKGITDDKARAQALLDIVNEINYFTAQPTQS